MINVPGAAAADASLSQRTNVVFMGTSGRSGSGKALIVQTGKATAFGQIAERLRLRPPETEFERGIRHLGYLLTQVMFVLVVMVFAINVVRGNRPVESLLFSVALAVGLTPQLLPAIININLSRGSQKMAKAGVIVRRLSAIENLGSMNVLCTDKTGTLTEGVVKLDTAADINGQPSDDIFRLAYLNAFYQTGMTNALDDAICNFKQIDVSHVTKVDEIPYDFERKRLTVVVKENDHCTMISKGALEPLLKECVNMVSQDQAQAIQGKYTEWSGQGLRVLAIATKDVPEKHPYTRDDEKGMKLAGFFLFFHPAKTGVKSILKALKHLGVQIKLIAGANKLVV